MARRLSPRLQRRLEQARTDLERVRRSIAMIESGAQSYSVGSRSAMKARLESLYKERARLEDLIDGLEGGVGLFRRVVPLDR